MKRVDEKQIFNFVWPYRLKINSKSNNIIIVAS